MGSSLINNIAAILLVNMETSEIVCFSRKSIVVIPKGITIQDTKLNTNINNGAKRKMFEFEVLGIKSSLVNNFKPSANGCNNPKIPTIFGPFRLCAAAIIFRSANV